MPPTDWTPSTADVAAVLRARTKDTNGNEVGDFTANTRPTGDEVTSLIGQSIAEVTVEMGDPDAVAVQFPESDPSQLYASLKRLVVLQTAKMVELSYFPEQVATGRSPYGQLVAEVDRASGMVTKATQELASGGQVGPGDDARLPQYNFPIQGNGMVGWGSRW